MNTGKANDIWEVILIPEFDTEHISAYQELKIRGNACRKPVTYADLVRSEGKRRQYEINNTIGTGGAESVLDNWCDNARGDSHVRSLNKVYRTI